MTGAPPPPTRPVVELLNVPAGLPVPQKMIDAVIKTHGCPDCFPSSYRLTFLDQPGGCTCGWHAEAWSAEAKHDPDCPSGWLADNRTHHSQS